MGLGSSMELVFKAILDRSNMASGLRAIEGQIQTFSNKIKNLGIMDAIGTELSAGGKEKIGGLISSFGALAGVGAAVGAGIGVAMSAVNGLFSVIGKGLHNFEVFEEATLRIARFTGSLKEAEEKMKEFDRMGDELSVADEQLADAYQTLRLIGGEAMATADNIRLIADASAAGRGSVDGLARSFAIVAGLIKSGEGTGKWGTKLARMGVISFEAKTAIDSLSKTLGGQDKAMEIFEKEWGKFTGSAEMKGRTMTGAMVRITDAIEDFSRALARPIAGSLGNILRDLADTLPAFEPLASLLGGVFAFLTTTINVLTTAVASLVDVFMGLGEAMEAESFAPFLKRMEKVSTRLDNFGRGVRSIVTGSMENEKVTKMKGAEIDYDEGESDKRRENIKKLDEQIQKIRRETDEIGMSNEEKLIKLKEDEKKKATEIAEVQKLMDSLKGVNGKAEKEEQILELQKEQAEIAKEIKQITQDTIDAKMKAAESESKKANEIYQQIKEGQDKREFDKSTPVEKLKKNFQERSSLEAEREKLQGEMRERSKDNISSPEDNAKSTALRAELERKIAEIDAKIAENRYQREEVIDTQSDDLDKAKGETSDYNTKRLMQQMRQDYGNDEDNKKAIELEKELHKARITQLEEEAKKLEEIGDLGGAERARLKATQEGDAIKDLDYDKRVNKGTQTMDGGQFAGSLAGSLLGVQYDNTGQEQVRFLGSIAELTKNTNEAIKLVADNTSKPIVISRFT